MDLGIKGKVALITGGARGLGKADAAALAKEGCRVVIVDVLEEELNRTVHEFAGKNLEVRGYRLDITDRTAVRETTAKIEREIGPVDILINNAAIVTTVAQLPNLADELWDRDIAVNLTGAYNLTKAIYPGMRDRKWGRVVYMASIAGLLGGFGQASYSSTKIGVVGLAKSLALEGERFNVTANVIAPGVIGTEMFHMIPEEMKDRMRKRIAFRKEGDPEDIANAIAFLVSERARYITGVILPVMGGMDLFTF